MSIYATHKAVDVTHFIWQLETRENKHRILETFVYLSVLIEWLKLMRAKNFSKYAKYLSFITK